MDWKTVAGILILPLIAAGTWLALSRWYAPVQLPIEEAIPFEQEGNLAKDNPGFDEGVWYLMYEKPGSPGLSIRLIFNSESRCGSEGYLKVCDISFDQGQRVHVAGFIDQGSLYVRELLYRTPQ